MQVEVELSPSDCRAESSAPSALAWPDTGSGGSGSSSPGVGATGSASRGTSEASPWDHSEPTNARKVLDLLNARVESQKVDGSAEIVAQSPGSQQDSTTQQVSQQMLQVQLITGDPALLKGGPH